ncbi:FtsX-like permease family protein [Micromonospora sp. KC723]|uniref:FtsX-like permease family protein n=1 Tax=Micromonospora sp. KC723 TaxID=2530381 RepID=UPI001049C1A1|nr:FtsX-like permease family protein [Micromonospora sp. KC723]TDB75607.1 FtsX-like permease family protein [Micromonospora sp. KC723]
MSVLAVARRVRAHGGHFLLLAVLALVTAVLVTGVPRVAERLAGQGLRAQLADLPGVQRDLRYTSTADGRSYGPGSFTDPHRRELDALAAAMPDAVRKALDERWYTADTAFSRLTGPELTGDKGLFDLSLRTTTGLTEAATLVEGRWPGQAAERAATVEVVLAEPVARALGVRAGSRLRAALRTPGGDEFAAAGVAVVGVFRPTDPAGGIWDALPSALRLTPPVGEGEPFQLVGLTDPASLDDRAAAGWPVVAAYRYRLDPGRLAPGRLDELVAGLAEVERRTPAGLEFTQGVDVPLRQYAAALAAARTLLAVITAGVLATLAGLTVLAARLAVRRRRDEYLLLRARGGSVTTLLRRGLAESVLVVPAAAGAGWLLGGLFPAERSAGGTPAAAVGPAVVAAVLATVALPAMVLADRHGGSGRGDLSRLAGGAGRLTVDVTLVGLAGLGAFLLRRRGLVLGGAVDPLLVSVPVLVAVAAAVLALRAYPWPLRLASRWASRARGAVAFLGTARAARAGAVAPLVVVVLAIATAAFCAVVAGGIEHGRDRAVTRAVPAEAVVAGERFAPDTAAALAALPGVRAVSSVLAEPGQRPYADADGRPGGAGEAYVLLVEPAGFAEVARRSGLDVAVPEALRGDPAASLPALASPEVAAALGEAALADRAGRRPGWVDVQGNRLPFRIAATVPHFPLVPADTGRFLVLPWPALPADGPHPLAPTGFLLASGGQVDPAAVARVAEEGQDRYQRSGVVSAGRRPVPPTVTTWTAERDRLGGSGVNGLLVFGFVTGASGGGVLGLLALAFAVLAGARGRAQVLSRLRTMGLSRRQWRGLLLVELVPLVLVSVLTGAVVGALLPVLLNPVLGLSAFTGGVPVTVHFAPGLVAGALGLAVLALAFALAVEAVNNRRMRLGEVLRLGEES